MFGNIPQSQFRPLPKSSLFEDRSDLPLREALRERVAGKRWLKVSPIGDKFRFLETKGEMNGEMCEEKSNMDIIGIILLVAEC